MSKKARSRSGKTRSRNSEVQPSGAQPQPSVQSSDRAPRQASSPKTSSTPAPKITPKMLWNGLPLVGAVAALIVGVTHGLGTSLLVVAATVLWVSVSFLWTSLQLLAGESSQGLEGSLAVDGPAAEEEQKRFLLQALKDLEFERSMGKIDDKDYEDLTHFYRNQAKSVLRALDDKVGPAREKAEVLIQKALEKEGLVALEETDKTDHPPPTESTPERLPCSECGTENDPDAAFCKRCGHAVDETEEEQGL